MIPKNCGSLILLSLSLTFVCLWPGTSSSAATSASPDASCLACHENPSLMQLGPDGKARSLSVDPAAMRRSVHGRLSCLDCHAAALGAVPHPAERGPVDCARCHPKAASEFDKSVHATPTSGLDRKGLPTCASCHGMHGITSTREPTPESFVQGMVSTCLGCHEDDALISAYNLPGKAFFAAYQKSVHGPGADGERKAAAASCMDCHGGHLIRAKRSPESSVNRTRVAETCRRCHESEFRAYSGSIHAQVSAAGATDAPVCTDCHGEHQILKPAAPDSKVASGHVAGTCASCHESEKIADKYRIPGRRLTTYLASYHGYANKFGEATVANCASCHGYHDILPSSDPRSRIHPAHLAETCGRCHPGAGPHFAEGKIHVEAKPENSFGVWVVRNFYTWFIGLLVAAFVTHATLDVLGKARRRRIARKAEKES